MSFILDVINLLKRVKSKQRLSSGEIRVLNESITYDADINIKPYIADPEAYQMTLNRLRRK